MASLTIGGQEYALRLSAMDVVRAEERLMKQGGRSLAAALATKNGDGGGFFGGYELEALCWGAWRHQGSDERVRGLLAQYYAEGGTFFALHQEVLEALIDSGYLGRRPPPAAPEAAAPDPPAAGRSA